MTPSFFGVDQASIAAFGAAVGAFLSAAYAAWRGNKAKPGPAPTIDVPKAAIPEDLQDQLDRIENRVDHTERKVDEITRGLHAIHTDTQVIREVIRR